MEISEQMDDRRCIKSLSVSRVSVDPYKLKNFNDFMKRI